MMLGCVVSFTSSHLSGSTLRDVNNGGSVLCSNSSFSSLLSSPNTNTDPSITLPDGGSPGFSPSDTFVIDDPDSTTFASFTNCHFISDPTPTSTRPLFFNSFHGSITLLSCSFLNAVLNDLRGGAVCIELSFVYDPNDVRVELCNFTDCSAEQSGGGLYLSKLAIVTVTGCRCEGCSITDSGISNFGGGMVIALPAIRNATVSDLSFEGCTSASNGGGICLQDAERTHIITSLSFKECYATNSDEKGNGGGMALSGRYGAPHNVTVSHLKFEDCSADRL